MRAALSMTLFIFSIHLACSSEIALSKMDTAEKWLCERGSLKRTARLVSETPGSAPCQVFYAKRSDDDPDDSIIEGLQDRGEVKPIYWARFQGDFCVRKFSLFIRERQTKGWSCSQLIP